ncbi:predicted protein [Nematostella vectensis]|uniref:Protein brambleberry n=1 Tax=Nematostella vectensis TaxID=45351 RepID=A7RG01_NEMVE|nr:predicted protein [Nematostella vectensis]|eukprot:XP_001641874.1 predicted protein [Nematostella vectensis]
MKNFNVIRFIFVFVVIVRSVDAEESGFELPTNERIKDGERSLQEFEAKARHSKCWKDAVANLHTSCKKMSDIEQSYLAVDFANCHLKKSGRKTYNCSRDRSIEDCTGNMDETAFSTYTHFFTHTTNICFYLQSQAWQEKTEDTISKLSSTSDHVVEQLESSLDNQVLLLKHQGKSLENQKQIIAREKELSHTLKSSTNQAKEAFLDMKTQASKQKAIFTETFEGIFKSVENIKQLQAMLLGEFITLQSLAFHFVSVCVCYFFTSSPRTANARLPLFMALVGLMGIERLVTACGVGNGSSSSISEVVHYRLWVCRKLFIFGSITFLLITAYKFQDYNKINHQMLLKIQQQIIDLKSLQGKEKSPQKALMNGDTIPMTSSSRTLPWMSQQELPNHSSTLTISDRVDSGLDSTDLEDIDVTYVPQETDSESESDNESVNTGSLPDLSTDSFLQSMSESFSSLKKTRDRATPRKSRSRATPRASMSPSHTYNLRPRRTPQSTPMTSSFIESMPSPSTLGELVEGLHRTTARYTAVLRKDKDKSNGPRSTLFSSDEEN